VQRTKHHEFLAAFLREASKNDDKKTAPFAKHQKSLT